MIYKILLCLFAVLIINNELLWSQDSAGGAGNSGAATGQAPTPPDFPEYIVTPREDLDNYNYSNMNKSSFSGQREDTGNFGKPGVKQNNVEINAQLQKMEEERKKSAAPATDEDVQTEAIDTESMDGTEYVQPKESISLYRWVDSDGILHVTDDFGSIPPEYQEQAFQGR